MAEHENGKPHDSTATPTEPATAPAKPNAQMKAVLDKLASLGGKPITSLKPEDARKEPSPADAVKALMKDKDIPGPEKVGEVDDIDIKLATLDLKGRVYKPEGDGPFPIILYIHGGGWVIADLDTYDATPRALANGANAIVVSTHYRQAPEYKFPAAHNDVYGAYQWVLKNGHQWGGNTKNIAVVGESAGGNMAAAICIMAQAEGIQMPVHQTLIYPVADTMMDTPSYIENADAKPLNAPMMKWFADHTFADRADAKNPKVALLQAQTLRGLPSATIITAQIDPLRSEGLALAKKLEGDGVKATYKNYDGVTHEFFGMGAVLDEAKQANALVCAELKAAFAAPPATPSAPPAVPDEAAATPSSTTSPAAVAPTEHPPVRDLAPEDEEE
ncbi:MAG: alpha/beta hydrolase [Verrucomicrobiaceae bacterium]|nr:MAG: alpha/beta hydrolase [Verrucomicrobiaceae bacterium]